MNSKVSKLCPLLGRILLSAIFIMSGVQMIHFVKNLSIMGGVLLVLGFGAGPLSLDRRSPATATDRADAA